jgi:hypothetical protein
VGTNDNYNEDCRKTGSGGHGSRVGASSVPWSIGIVKDVEKYNFSYMILFLYQLWVITLLTIGILL